MRRPNFSTPQSLIAEGETKPAIASGSDEPIYDYSHLRKFPLPVRLISWSSFQILFSYFFFVLFSLKRNRGKDENLIKILYIFINLLFI